MCVAAWRGRRTEFRHHRWRSCVGSTRERHLSSAGVLMPRDRSPRMPTGTAFFSSRSIPSPSGSRLARSPPYIAGEQQSSWRILCTAGGNRDTYGLTMGRSSRGASHVCARCWESSTRNRRLATARATVRWSALFAPLRMRFAEVYPNGWIRSGPTMWARRSCCSASRLPARLA